MKVPPIVLSWNSWNCPFTKRRTRLDLPTADSPRRTSLNWQILLPAFGPLGLVAPALPAMTLNTNLLYWNQKCFSQTAAPRSANKRERDTIRRVLWYVRKIVFLQHYSVRQVSSKWLFNGVYPSSALPLGNMNAIGTCPRFQAVSITVNYQL